MQILTLQDFGDLLDNLPVGQNAELPCTVYQTLFPPGEPDEWAPGRAYEFARSHGCTIDNQSAVQRVLFIRAITNPSR
jgi:hypothetical protein